jgi:chemotaxis protein CheD
MVDPGTGSGSVVGVADLATGTVALGQLVTYALGSCIGLSAYDPVARVGGLLHYMLPQPTETGEPPLAKPYMYATTGIPLLFRRLQELGARKERLVVCAAGGAEILEGGSMFAIGRRNHTMLRKIFWKDGIALAAEDIGGNQARTMSLLLATGEVRIRTRGAERVLWRPGQAASLPVGKELR